MEEKQINNKKEKNIFLSKLTNMFTFIGKNTPVYIIGIDVNKKMINILNMLGKDISTATITKYPYKTRSFDQEFYETLSTSLEKFLLDKPSNQSSASFLVLPNECVSIEMINLPTVSKVKMNSSLNINLESAYKNKKDLIINDQVMFSNKQYTTYQIVSLQKSVLAQLYTCLASSKLFSKSTTYNANALLNSVFTLKGKNKGHNFVFVDIKKDCTYFAISYKGKTVGYYYLQFGYSILESKKLVYENMLSDHDLAEVTVLNAKEKAKSKQLTVVEEHNEDDTEKVSENSETNVKVLGKKMPKKLPKFMQRPAPETDEDLTYENFRIFMKWIMLVCDNLHRNNQTFVIDYALVNMPKEYNFVLEKANNENNEEEKSDKNEFKYVPFNEDLDLSNDILENLELLGALYSSFNKNHVF